MTLKRSNGNDYTVAQVVAAFAVALFAIVVEVAIHYAGIVAVLREIRVPGGG